MNLFLGVLEFEFMYEFSEWFCLIKVIDVLLKICFNLEENIYGYMMMVNYNYLFNGFRLFDLVFESLDGLKIVDLEIVKLINI